MTDPNTLQIALISSSSAIAGAVISQIVAISRDILGKRHQRNLHLREKYEQLADHISDSQAWGLELTTSPTLHALSLVPLPIHARKAVTISSIYFPALQNVCQEYLNACVTFKIFLIDHYPKTPGKDVGTSIQQHHGAKYAEAAQLLMLARQAVDDKIIELASKYAKA